MACNVHEEKIKQSGTQEGKLKKTTSNTLIVFDKMPSKC